MSRTFIHRPTNLIHLAVFFFTLFALGWGNKAAAQVSFNRGNVQTLTVCQNSSGIPIDTLLPISDPTSGLTETWRIATPPVNGTLSLDSSTATSTGGTVLPTGWLYTPTSSVSGNDSFTIQVSNGTNTVTTLVRVTINPIPAVNSITGTTTSCVGGVTTLNNTTTGGFWYSDNTSVATISGTGNVTATGVGTTLIIYNVTNGFGCSNAAYATYTVNTVPTVAAITGPNAVCVGFGITLADATTSGIWSSSNATIATVNSGGFVTGVAVGSATISYSVTNSCGTTDATYGITVSSSTVADIAPATATICAGSTITLTNSTIGGTWSTSSSSIATVDATGVVTGVSSGSATIFYTITNSCGTINKTRVVTVNGTPTLSSISGTTLICTGTSTFLSNTFPGGIWSSSNAAIASVEAVTGRVYGVSVGTANITYTATNSCGTSNQSLGVTISSGLATPATILGTVNACVGGTTTLTNATVGGTWSSANTAVATVDSVSGVVTGISAGSVVISYTVTSSCGSSSQTASILISAPPAAPAAITGTTSICVGSSSVLASTTSGGTWSAVTTSVATINATGTVFGVSSGVTTISYTASNFCGSTATTTTVTVSVPPTTAPITGLNTVCLGSFITLSDASTGGSWSSSNNAVASVDAFGNVRGNGTGTATITYGISGTCGLSFATTSIAVTTVPTVLSITGTTAICNGATTNLIDLTASGTWSSTATSVATISNTGQVTGLSAGSTTISYTVANSCGSNAATTVVTVTDPPSAPAAITGTTTVCVGGTTTLASTTTGGVWSSATTSTASVNSSGVVRGVSTGTVTISYTSVNFCGSASATASVSVITAPVVATVVGASTVCLGGTTTLTDATTGGSWSSSNTATATVSNTGDVYGVSTGPVTITYTVTNICGSNFKVKSITVINTPATPAAIGGPSSVCRGTSITATDATASGTWSTADASIASINSSTGSVFGVAVGSVDITYTVTNTCGSSFVTRTISVTTTPTYTPISGSTTICVGSTGTLTEATPGGAWSTSNASIASITTTGTLRGIAVGSANVTYTASNSCGTSNISTSISVITTPSLPTPISGSGSGCAGSTFTQSTTATGGVWSSSNTAIATVDTGGVVYGLSGGTFLLSYTVTNACGSVARTKSLTILPVQVVAPIGGTATVCVGSVTTLTNATALGTWSSSNTSIATVSTTGAVTGVSTGTVTISYTVVGTCGTATSTRNVTVNTVPVAPSAITGTTTTCAGTSTTLSSTTTGGTWSSSNSAIATANTGGVVTGVAGGSVTITYASTNACGTTPTTTTYNVTTTPAIPALIGGPTSVCLSSTITLTNDTAGGVWTSSNTGVATISTIGVVYGQSLGTVNISYTVSNSCGSTTRVTPITVITIPFPAAIGGASTVCAGSTTTLTNSTTGGAWTSANPSIASVNSTGVVTGVTPGGSTTITYTVTNTCGSNFASKNISVVNVPPIGPITGAASTVCVGTTLALSDTSAGGTWSSSAAGTATVSNTGVVTGLVSGTVTISYTVTNGCGNNDATYALTVSALPVVPAIVGATTQCIGSTITMSNSATGGSWATTNPSVATVNTSGVVTGLSAGTTTIVYSVTNFCGTTFATKTDTVNSTIIDTITGPTNVCIGSIVTLANATTGGTWTSANSAIASVNSTTGAVKGISRGSVNITYSILNSCGTTTRVRSITVDDSYVASIQGLDSVCVASTITLTDSTTGGNWSSVTSTVAGVNPLTGEVTGISAGSSVIIYAVTNTCGTFQRLFTVYVNPLSIAGTITGPGQVCLNSTVTLVDPAPSGSWSSGNPLIATVSSTGDVTASGVGTTLITYSVVNSCGSQFDTASILVNPLPFAGIISGDTELCANGIASVGTTGDIGGTWESSNTSLATVDASGRIYGSAAGAVTISYIYNNVCGSDTSVYGVTVNALPIVGAITGPNTVCENATISLSDTTAVGVWSSSNPAVATIGALGLVTGVSAGPATITFATTNAFGCTSEATFGILVNPLPDAGVVTPALVCEGGTAMFASTVLPGFWVSSTPSVATVDPTTGMVTGLTSGIDTIYHLFTNVCGTDSAAAYIAVLPRPFAGVISGPANVCENTTVTLTSTVSGGRWDSYDPPIAIVDTLTGEVYGVAEGTTLITYGVTTACGHHDTTVFINVLPLPRAGSLSGITTVCELDSTTLSSTTSGGVWTVTPLTIATIDSNTGVLHGVVQGSASAMYTYTNACGLDSASIPVTVNPLPHAGIVSGSDSVCGGSSVVFSSTITGGRWSSGTTAIATVDTLSGTVYGISSGLVNITYTVTNSCGSDDTFKSIYVNVPFAGTIGGPSAVCVNDSITLTSTVASGYWASSNNTVATVNAGTGKVYGVSSGSASLYYVYINTCGRDTARRTITVNPLPNAGTITGIDSVCIGSTTNLSVTGSVGTGTWSAPSPSIASVNASGRVFGVAAGSARVSYTATTTTCGSKDTFITIRVLPIPTPGTISGSNSVCVGNSIALTHTGTYTGTWSSSNTARATVDASGTVYGLSAATVDITYTVSNYCGTVFTVHSVNIIAVPTSTAITGSSPICQGSTYVFTASQTGGTRAIWSSTDTTVATVDSLTGSVTGVRSGTSVISYLVTNACGSAARSYSITVNPLPVAGTITGTLSLCANDTTTLRDTATGGVWSSTSTGVATISTTGRVTARGVGTTSILYTVSNSCGVRSATVSFVVNALPNAGVIRGASSVCEASTITLSDTLGTVGGSWASSAISIASIISSTGVLTGVAQGVATISYVVTTAICGSDTAFANITVRPLPQAGAISGPSSVCTNNNITLVDTFGGSAGTWLSSNVTIASVSSTGVVRGRTAGTVTITYIVSNVCGSDTALATVNVLATPSAGTLTVPGTVCPGASITVTTTGTPGGRWASSVPGVATIDSNTGSTRGMTGGLVTITYTVTSASCGTYFSTDTLRVIPTPDAGTVTGSTILCVGGVSQMTDTFGATGGSWTCSPTAVATISPTGVLRGLTAGSVIVSYSVTNICGSSTDTMLVTVLAPPSGGRITGSRNVCMGSTIFLANSTATPGGVWTTTSSNALVDISTAEIIPIAPGSLIVTYTVTSAYCGSASDTFAVTVVPLANPGIISGTNSVCVLSTTTLSTTGTGGTWTIAPTTYANISSGGLVTGISAGTAVATYTVVSAICGAVSAYDTVTVNPLPNAGTITGGPSVCVSSTISLGTTGMTGGAWTMPTSSYATIDATGLVSGLAAGTVIATYTVTTPTCGSASDTILITVNPLPDAGTISLTSGSLPVCERSTVTLSTSGTGGSWSTADATIASVNTAGVVTGTGGGTTTISYTVTSATCSSATATYTVSVSPLPSVSAIYGATSVCLGDSTVLLNSTTGGTWTSSDTYVAPVDSATGLVHGNAVGAATIYYTVANSCGSRRVSFNFNVNPLANAGTITGISTVCVGSTTTLSSTVSGGTWSTVSTYATVNPTTGNVLGIAAGLATITYTSSTATCGSAFTTRNVTIIAIPSADTILGVATLCEGSSIGLTTTATGGAWSSSNTSVAPVSNIGQVFGVATGIAVISYTVSNVCGADTAFATVSVDPLPRAGNITGPNSLCVGTPATLTVSATGGNWSSRNPSIATVSTTGDVAGLAFGTDSIYYVVNNSCGSDTATKVVTVNILPDAGTIVAPRTILCLGDSMLLTNTATLGYWNTSNEAIAKISNRTVGYVVGVAAGTVMITYTVTNVCGTAYDTIQIDVRPVGRCDPDAVDELTGTAKDVTVYPNPAISTVHVKASVNVRINVITPDGKLMITQQSNNDVDVSNLSAGVYVIMIYDDNNQLLKVSRFVKAE